MKNNKPDAALLRKQLEEDLVPRLRLNLPERVVSAHLVRLSRLAGKTQLRFSIEELAGTAHLSHTSARQAVRRLIAKGALRLVDRTQAGHRVEVFLPEEIQGVPHQGPAPACLAKRWSGLLRIGRLDENAEEFAHRHIWCPSETGKAGAALIGSFAILLSRNESTPSLQLTLHG